MSRSMLVLLIALGATTVQAEMDCNFGTSSNFLEKSLNTCPGILDSSDKAFCCVGTNSIHCCDAQEFALSTGVIGVVAIIIAVVGTVSIIIFCISCLCCSCCPWYRRRHRGTVYGKVQTPAVITVMQPTTIPTPQAQLYPTVAPGNQIFGISKAE
uniref:Shisa4_2 protein n=1 Tax=Fopius arisanus TaxID=64838 RepID=A0A0C9R491_9HYME